MASPELAQELTARARVRLIAAVLLMVGLIAGCGGSGGGQGGGSTGGGVSGASFGGRIFGGGPQNPISGSTVTLYEMTTSGYGAAGHQLATTTSNSSGGFTFTPGYTCISATDQTYVTGTGGNPGSGVNSAIAMVSLTGPCGSLSSSTFLLVSELTTAAAEWALAQFSDSTGANFGTSSGNTTGLNNAVNQAESNLVVSYLSSGGTPSNVGIPASFLPWSPFSSSCTSTTSTSNCDALQRLDTLANIIALCVNSSGPSSASCSILLGATNNSTDTLAAAHVIVTNPTVNTATIYGVMGPPSLAPFQPALGSVPSDFTLALNFAPTGASFVSPSALALDSAGNVFIANNGSGIRPSGSVSELTAASGYAAGLNFTSSTGASFDSPVSLALDSAGNVFVANNSFSVRPSGSVSELTEESDYAAGMNFSSSTGATFDGPSALALDSLGNVFIANEVGDTVSELTEASGYGTGMNFAPMGASFDTPSALALDSANNVFVANNNGSVGSGGSVSELTAASNYLAGTNYAPTGASFDGPSSLALELDGTNNVFVANNSFSVRPSGSVSELFAVSDYLPGGQNYAPTGASFDGPSSLALDGAGNVFVANNDGDSVSELFAVSDYLTGGQNYAPTGASFDGPSSLALDSAGNVFVANNQGNSVSELIGLGKPVLTPIQACLQHGNNCLP
ncbi:MAG: hypothetical protein ACLQDV_18650 [Candidatus Binataceae bacterium]